MSPVVPGELDPPTTIPPSLAVRIHNRSNVIELTIIGRSGNITGQGAP
jgi:hypothetical protein